MIFSRFPILLQNMGLLLIWFLHIRQSLQTIIRLEIPLPLVRICPLDCPKSHCCSKFVSMTGSIIWRQSTAVICIRRKRFRILWILTMPLSNPYSAAAMYLMWQSFPSSRKKCLTVLTRQKSHMMTARRLWICLRRRLRNIPARQPLYTKMSDIPTVRLKK